MNDILVIGGPENGLQGVDRVDDDVVSILGVEGLYDRKWVVVWPTTNFFAPPTNTSKLHGHIDVRDAVDSVAAAIGFIPLGHPDPKSWFEAQFKAAKKDKVAVDKEVQHMALMKAICLLAKLQLAVAGGQNLVVIIGNDAFEDALCWTNLVSIASVAKGCEIRDYDSDSPVYGILNSVSKWDTEFPTAHTKEVSLRKLVPMERIYALGDELPFDVDWYMAEAAVLDVEARISLPVIGRFGDPRAIQVDAGRGCMLVISPPTKPRTFVITMKEVAVGQRETLLEPPNAGPDDQDELCKKAKGPGRPKERNKSDDDELLRKWGVAKAEGRSRKLFCKEQGIDPDALEAARRSTNR